MSKYNELSPYINTVNSTLVYLHPRDLRNNLYNSLKKNLQKEEEGKYINDVGFIVKIFKIMEYKVAPLVMENTNGSVPFRVKYSCRICSPRRNHQIICKVVKINKFFISMKNGPIFAFATNDRINLDNFILDKDNNVHYKVGENQTKILKVNDYVKINVDQTKYTSEKNVVTVMANIENMASDGDIELFAKDLHDHKGKLIDLESYKNNKYKIIDDDDAGVVDEKEEVVLEEEIVPEGDIEEDN